MPRVDLFAGATARQGRLLGTAKGELAALQPIACGGDSLGDGRIEIVKAISMRIPAVALVLAVAGTMACQVRAGGELVKFPESYADGVLYATVNRGNITQEIFTSRTALDAVKKGLPIPSGTVITMVDYRDGKLFRYVVMEKRTGWGAGYPPEKRNGEWEFQAFNADRTVNRSEDLGRCFACHRSKESQDFVFTYDRMKSANWTSASMLHFSAAHRPTHLAAP